jgi:hypothetical protein
MQAIRPATELGRLAFFSIPVITGAAALITHATCWALEKKGIINPKTTYILSAISTLLTYLATAIALTTLGIVSINGAAVMAIPALVVAGMYFTLFFLQKSEAKPFDPAKTLKLLDEIKEICEFIEKNPNFELFTEIKAITHRFVESKNSFRLEKDLKKLRFKDRKDTFTNDRITLLTALKESLNMLLPYILNDKVAHPDMENKLRSTLYTLEYMDTSTHIDFNSIIAFRKEVIVYIEKNITPLFNPIEH